MKRFLVPILVLVGTMVFAQTLPQPVATIIIPGKLKGQNLTDRIRPEDFRVRVEAAQQVVPGGTLTAKQRTELLDDMISERLILLAAQRDGVVVSDAEVNRQVDALRADLSEQLGGREPTAAEFAEAVRNSTGGLTVDAFIAQLKSQAVIQRYIAAKRPNFQQTIQAVREASPGEVEKFYNDNKTSFSRDKTVWLSMIQVPIGEGQANRTKARDLIDRLARDIGQDLGKFDETTLQGQTEDAIPRLGYNAGPIYIAQNARTRSMYGDRFVDPAFSLAQGKVSPVIEAAGSFVIFKVLANYGAKLLDLTDPVQVGNPTTVQDYIEANLVEQRRQELIKKTITELVEEIKRGAQITRSPNP